MSPLRSVPPDHPPRMNPFANRTAKSARRKAALALLGVLAVLGTSALGVLAAGKADFSVAASPGHQTTTKGQAVTYTVSVSRANGFSDPVTLSVAGLPAGTTASWKLSNGVGSNVVPSSLNSATLTVQTTAGTPGGTANMTINATGGKLTRSTPVSLSVEPPAQPGFSVTASPVTRTVLENDETTYAIDVQRTGGFTGAVSLAVDGLPKGATAAWSPSSVVPGSGSAATLTITTDGNPKTGAYDLLVTGSGVVGSSSVQRIAAVTLVVDKGQSLQISGDLGSALSPGVTVPLDLALTNPNNFPIQVQSVSVSVEEGTSRPGCSGTQNFVVTDLAAGAYPLTVPANSTRTLSQLGVAAASRPQVQMPDQASNQDACKGATVHLNYSGTATK